MFNKNTNDFKHDVGMTSDLNHAFTDLHGDMRYQWNNFKDIATETIQDAFALRDNALKVIDNFFEDLNDFTQ